MLLTHIRKISLTSFILYIGLESFVAAQSRHKQKNIDHITPFQKQSRNRNEPNYIFILPENQTLILRKSDFDHMIYPNVTNVNKFNKDLQHTGSVTKESLYDNKSDEEDYENIVKKNIQTERNFVNFIEEMNLDLNSEEVKAKRKNTPIKNKVFKDEIETNKKINQWDDLGLDGWEGAITEKRKNKTKNV